MGKKLTQKTFLLLTALSLTVCLFAYGCIWFFLPYVDKKHAMRELEERTSRLVKELRLSEKEKSEPLFLDFIRETGAELCLWDEKGRTVSFSTFQKINTKNFQDIQKIQQPFKFVNADDEYLLLVRYHPYRSKEMKDAILRSIPYVAAVTALLSIAGAWIFSCYTTRPILRIHRIAGKMAELDFSWYCPDEREDEIGMLSKSINELSDKLHEALEELHRRNTSLEDEIQIEKERERRRMLFFSGISHELKTPVSIVIGQLEGMQAGIGVYKDREKYLARSAEILQSLNRFLKEILFVSHIDLSDAKEETPVDLSKLTDTLLQEYDGYAEFSAVELHGHIEENLSVCGNEPLLKKAIGNIIGNAVTHSPEHAVVRVDLFADKGAIKLSVENAPAHIAEEHLPHLFEAFYRADASEPSAEHGSGLGLYITRLILETCRIPHMIENTADGVCFTAVFHNI